MPACVGLRRIGYSSQRVASPHYDAERRVGTILDQRFRVDKLLGAGAMGAVYVATASNGHTYAIKLLLHDEYQSNPDLIARFVREGRLTTSLDAPNVVKVYELAVDAPTHTPFIVMEKLEGCDLEELVKRVGPVHPRTAVRIALQAARGLATAHDAGIIHRDIKPANLFLDRQGSGVVVKVCDFGVAKSLIDAGAGGAVTATGMMMGSPLYMSPEQIRSSKHVDARSDVWSLAVAIFELLAGKGPFTGVTSLSELMVSISTKPVPWLQDFAPWVDPALARVVNACLLANIDARCPSMQALCEALQPFAGGDESLTEADLVGAPHELQSTAAPRGQPASSWAETAPRQGARQDPALHALLGQTLAGRYYLDSLLGAGGMGAVFAARAQDGTPVAVKIVLGDPVHQKPEVWRRFVREARATTSIESPHVVRVIDVDSDRERGFPFIVMELLQGTDLDRLVKGTGPLEPEAVAAVFVQACAGLAAAHKKGVVHRDIKPANLYLQVTDGRMIVKICDFGIAKQLQTEGDAASTELTSTGGMLGSPMYMSPEQARSAKHVDHTTDIWSLGIALYESLTGKRPWEHCTTVGDLIVAICTQEVPPIQQVAPWIEPGLAAVVHTALAREPAQRFPSMEAFAEALAPFAGQEVSTSTLVAVNVERKSRVAPRLERGLGSTTAAASTRVIPPKRTPWFAFAAVAVVIAGGLGTVFVMNRGETPRPAPAATAEKKPDPEPTAKPTASVAKLKIAVRITPPEADVTVDGKSATVAGGVLSLEGEPGDAFAVVVKHKDKKQERQVMIGKDGKGSVEAIDVAVDKKPTPVATGTAKPTATKSTGEAVATVAPPTATPPTATAPPAATPTGPVGASTF